VSIFSIFIDILLMFPFLEEVLFYLDVGVFEVGLLFLRVVFFLPAFFLCLQSISFFPLRLFRAFP